MTEQEILMRAQQRVKNNPSVDTTKIITPKADLTPEQINNSLNAERKTATSTLPETPAPTATVEPEKSMLGKAGEAWKDFQIGAAKGIGDTAISLGEAAAKGKFTPGADVYKMALEKAGLNIDEHVDKIADWAKQYTEAKNTAQEAGKAAEFVAELAVPVGKVAKIEKTAMEGNAAKKALELTTEELGKINKKKLKYLSPQGLENVETVGGLIKKKAYGMADEVKKLQDEFSHIFKSGNPEENLKAAQQTGKKLDQLSTKLVEANNRPVAQEEFIAHLRESLKNLKDSAYTVMSKAQKKALQDASIEDFLSHVKEPTLEGINNARKSFSKTMRDPGGSLSKANELIHKATQDFIQKNLPEEASKLYQTNKVQMRKLFDVREILRAKKAASIGKAALVDTAKTIGKATGLVGGATYLINKFK